MPPPQISVPLLRPPAPPPDATICAISPASFALDDRFSRGMDRLRTLGFKPSSAVHTQIRGPLFFAGEPADRLFDFHTAFTDLDSQIVAAVRGGYGSNYLLPNLDLELIRRNPKPFFAYSDLTGSQLHLLDRIGLPVFHGPMIAADFYLEDGVHLPSLRAALTGQPYSLATAEDLRTLKPGIATGTLYGGCLSIITSLLGTPWEPNTEGKLLFLEDVGAKPYQIDRMLWQLHTAGKFDNVTGIIFGEMLDCASPGAEPDLLDQVILRFFSDFPGPIAIGLRSGHVSRSNVTLTFGVPAQLDASEAATLSILKPAVRV
ncbi:MAG: LD-carboxypeptidase [Acidobacteriota bacterium]|nr:LD-carboxypeptidase [Acidobacteriota bacterium]